MLERSSFSVCIEDRWFVIIGLKGGITSREDTIPIYSYVFVGFTGYLSQLTRIFYFYFCVFLVLGTLHTSTGRITSSQITSTMA